jgi:transposase
METNKTTDWREQRRLQALNLREKGWSYSRIGEALGVTKGAICQWMKRVREGGRQALLRHPPPGMVPRLTPQQKAELPALLLKGPQAYGFTGEVWTSERVAWLIEFKFGIKFHRAHVCRILKQIGWSVQKPVEKATQRDEEAIEKWRTERWPELKKKAEAEERVILWLDQRAFYLLPQVVRT